jgi:hypothetical protein
MVILYFESIFLFCSYKIGNIIKFFKKFFFNSLSVHLVFFNIVDLNLDILFVFLSFFDLGINKLPSFFRVKYSYRQKKRIKVLILRNFFLLKSKGFKLFYYELCSYLFYRTLKKINIILFPFSFFKYKYFFSINLNILLFLNRNFYINNCKRIINCELEISVYNVDKMLNAKCITNLHVFFFKLIYFIFFLFFLVFLVEID